MTVLDNVRIGGVVATGCHGARAESRTIVDQVVGFQIVAGDGKLHEFSDEKNRDEMEAARVNLGKSCEIPHLIFRHDSFKFNTVFIITRRSIRNYI